MLVRIIGILFRLVALSGLGYFFYQIVAQFRFLDVCVDYVPHNAFYLTATLIPVLLAIVYSRKFPLIVVLCGIMILPLYVMFMLYPQEFYINKIIVKLCSAYHAESMQWGNYFQYPNTRTFYETSGAKHYLNLYLYSVALLIGIVVHTIAYWPQVNYEDDAKKNKAFTPDWDPAQESKKE